MKRSRPIQYYLPRVILLGAFLCSVTLAVLPLTAGSNQDLSELGKNTGDQAKNNGQTHLRQTRYDVNSAGNSPGVFQDTNQPLLNESLFSKVSPYVVTGFQRPNDIGEQRSQNATIFPSDQREQRQERTEEFDGPEVIRDRVLDYLRRHGMDGGFDPNQRLQLVKQEYERTETEKVSRLLHPEAIPGTNWISLGPTNGAGRMTAIAVHPTIAGTVYVGAAGGGLWKSTDGGSTWASLTDSINDLFVGAVAIAPSSPNIVYLGSGEGNTLTPGIGILKSTDGGVTWQFPSSVIASSFYKISVHPTNPQDLVVGAVSAGYRSTDGGQSWTTIIPSSDVTDIVRSPNNPQVLYATTRGANKILKSTDDGITWVAKSNGVPVQSLDRLAIAISPANPLVLYVAGATQDAIAHIYKTNDGGESWSELSGISSDPNLRYYFATSNQSWYDNTLVVSPSDPNVVIAGGVSYVKTTDGGATWATPFGGGGYPHADVHDLQYQGSTLYIANDGGIWSSADNAQSATDRNSTLVTRQYYTVANDPINLNRVYGGGWEQVLESNKVAFTSEFVQRSRFTSAYPTSLTPAQLVDALFAHAGVTPSSTDRNAAIAEFGSATNTADVAARARALRLVAENATLTSNESNRAFVLMQYFGYLRRNPNDPQDLDYTGYDFWLTKLNQFNGNFVNADMVKAFITSGEYRQRFGL